MAALKLKQLVNRSYYIPAPALMGIFTRGDRVVLIDSGNDKEAGRQILKLCEERGWLLDLIVNTHSNADHIGGNAFLQKKTGCRIAATRLEAAFIQDPVLEPAFLYGGYPPGDLRNKFLMAHPSKVTDIISPSGEVLDTGLAAIPLPGHYFEMVGIRTPDDVVFLADCLFPESIMTKYHIFFLYDLGAHLETLKRIQTLEAEWYVPSHGVPTNDIGGLVEMNRKKIEEILSVILSFCVEPASVEGIVTCVCTRYEIELDANQYALVTSTIRSYLSYLETMDEVEKVLEGGRLLWQGGERRRRAEPAAEIPLFKKKC
jgi:glyoxylase-like metal-dependent hydrolase (beta-lactamase superfamily II)